MELPVTRSKLSGFKTVKPMREEANVTNRDHMNILGRGLSGYFNFFIVHNSFAEQGFSVIFLVGEEHDKRSESF
jgi:hypothetical protein